MRNHFSKTTFLRAASLVLVVAMVFGLFASVSPSYAQGPDRRPGMGGFGMRGGGSVQRAVVAAVVKVTNLTQIEILQQWVGGKTLTDIITENGGTVEAVTTDAKTTLTDAINKLVTNGRLTQAQADAQIAEIDAAITTMLSTSFTDVRDNVSGRVIEFGVDAALLRATLDVTGLTRDVLIPQLTADGATYASVIVANGKTVDEVKAAATKLITDRLNEAAANGRLAQKQVDELLAELPAALDAALNAGLPEDWTRFPGDRGGRIGAVVQIRAVGELVKVTAEQTGLTQREVLQQLRDGQTLAEIAASKSIEPSAIVTATVTNITALVNEQVANGRLTQEQADTQLANLSQTLTDLMNKANPLTGSAMGRRPGRGNR